MLPETVLLTNLSGDPEAPMPPPVESLPAVELPEKVLFTMPRGVAVRSTVINHSIHHRGQLTVYLRLLGVPVPPTYGPTADSQGF